MQDLLPDITSNAKNQMLLTVVPKSYGQNLQKLVRPQSPRLEKLPNPPSLEKMTKSRLILLLIIDNLVALFRRGLYCAQCHGIIRNDHKYLGGNRRKRI